VDTDAADPPGQPGDVGQPGHWGQHGHWGLPLRIRRRLVTGPRGSGPLRRDRDGSLLGGVASGLATRMGWDVTVVRTVFVLAALVSGLGAAPYALAWLLIPVTGESRNIASTAVTDRRGIGQAAAIASVLVVALVIGSALGAGWLGKLAWGLVIAVPVLWLIWRNAPPDEQEPMRRIAEPVLGVARGTGRSWIKLRVLAGFILAGAGLGVLLSFGHQNAALLQPLGGILLILGSVVVLLGPWWLRIARDLMVERRARVRAEERADMAARVHDSVLQTLALIQRRAGDPQQVVALARAQERELRSWLFDGRAPGSLDGQAVTLAAGVRLIQQEVEAQHGVAVEAVTVGDCELDEDVSALLAAAREATVNAVKWSGAPVVALFAEVEPGAVSLYVRDRGQGFDPDAVPSDRKGVAESIRARMARRGGSATVRSAPGEGTEVSLRMPRATAGSPAGRS
jgi:signal transduction histidine kinase/phage shock protein PspC (stress-responsive transcriptional regulator)